MAGEPKPAKLCDLLITTKDGDWGKDHPEPGKIPYRVIRGADFPQARVGDVAEIPRCYLNADSVHRRTLQADDIIIETAGGNRDRPTGRTLLVTQRLLDSLDLPATCASFCRFLRVDPELAEPRYVFWFLQWLYARGAMWEHQVQHTGVARFQYTRFAETPLIPLPDRKDQQAIACILGSLDAKIELNRRMNRSLESMLRATFRSWFIDFDPVRSKSYGGDPRVPAQIGGLFPSSFEESSVGEIPKGWSAKTVGDLADVVGGSTPRTTEASYWNDGVHAWATPKDLSKLAVPVLLETERRISDSGLAQISSGLLPAGTVLLSSRAPIGYLAIAEVPVAINQGFIAMKPRKSVSNLFLLLWAHVAHDDIVSRANGSTFLEISKANFRPIPLAAPPPGIFDAFDGFARPFYARIVSNERETRILTSVRDALVPKLLSGELSVPDAERTAARCA